MRRDGGDGGVFMFSCFYGIGSFMSDTIITGRLCSICLDSSGNSASG